MEIDKLIEKIDFKKVDNLIPAVIQDKNTGVVLMLGYMNKKALQQTWETKKVTFYSRTKKKIWVKGETSGNFLELKSMKLDCDNDALLVKVNPLGPVCHKGTDSCWEAKNQEKFSFIYDLEKIAKKRKANPSVKSYTSLLFKKGINKIAQKVGEEAVELVIEAKDNNADNFKGEMADLVYHLTVLLVEKGMSWNEIMEVLEKRRR